MQNDDMFLCLYSKTKKEIRRFTQIKTNPYVEGKRKN